MQSGILMVSFILTTVLLQFCGFFFSQVIDRIWPTAGLLTFLVCFLAAFPLAWPIAVRIAEWLIRRAGYVVDTEQSGGTLRRDSWHPTTRSGAPHRVHLTMVRSARGAERPNRHRSHP